MSPTERLGGNHVTYTLGLDLGTTASAVALNVEGVVSMFSVGHRDLVVPSVVYLGSDDGEAGGGDDEENGNEELVLVGQAAERRATSDPSGIAREFKRRFGDPQPLILNGTPVAANDLTLRLALYLVEQVTEQRGEAPAELVVCHPANWGDYKLALLSDTLNNSSLPPHRLLSEPVAAAIHDATQETIEPGSTVAVYDLGGGTFDVALLRKLDDGWEPIGKPGGIERLGGIDFDTAVLHHVVSSLTLDLTSFEDDDLAAQSAMFRLRDECKAAKHALSEDTSTSIPVLLPGVNETVRMTRSEFEALIGPAISRTLEVLDATIAASPIEMTDIDRVLLVGGSSQIPVVRQRVMNHTRRPVAIDRHPKHAIALGAAASIDGQSVVDMPAAVVEAPAPAAVVEAPAAVGEAPALVDDEVPNEPPMPDESAASNDAPAAAPPTPSADPVKEMYELPHISEAPLPDFLHRGDVTPPTPSAATPGAAIPPTPGGGRTRPPTPSPAQATPAAAADPAAVARSRSSRSPNAGPPPRLVAPPAEQTVIEPRGSQHLAASPGHPDAAVPAASHHSEVRRSGGAGFWLLVVLLAGLAGGATYYFLRDAGSSTATGGGESAATTTATTIATTSDGAGNATTEQPSQPTVTTPVFETSCSTDQLPDPNIRYQVSEPADGFLNGRNVPSVSAVDGVESTPVVTFLVLTELDLTYVDCEVDARGRAWWGVNSPEGLVWSSTRFIEPVP